MINVQVPASESAEQGLSSPQASRLASRKREWQQQQKIREREEQNYTIQTSPQASALAARKRQMQQMQQQMKQQEMQQQMQEQPYEREIPHTLYKNSTPDLPNQIPNDDTESNLLEILMSSPSASLSNLRPHTAATLVERCAEFAIRDEYLDTVLPWIREAALIGLPLAETGRNRIVAALHHLSYLPTQHGLLAAELLQRGREIGWTS
jgi:hypothetical protein